MSHLPGCRVEAEFAALRDWTLQWPAHCETCRARGYITEPAGRDHPGCIFPCGCIDAGNCPRCGKYSAELAIDGTPACPHCGWTGKGPDDLAPKEPECYCHEFEERPDDAL